MIVFIFMPYWTEGFLTLFVLYHNMSLRYQMYKRGIFAIFSLQGQFTTLLNVRGDVNSWVGFTYEIHYHRTLYEKSNDDSTVVNFNIFFFTQVYVVRCDLNYGWSFERDHVDRGPVSQQISTIKVPPSSKTVSPEQRPNVCSPTPAMVTSPCSKCYMSEIFSNGRLNNRQSTNQLFIRYLERKPRISWV